MSQDKLLKLLQDVEKSLRKGNSASAWDEYTPIVSEGNCHSVYLTGNIEEPYDYSKLCHMLYSANEYDEFRIVINSLGGVLDSAFMIVDAIKNSKARTTCRLTGTIASAATIIALSCDELETSSNLSFMIHNYSASGVHGKGHEMKARQNFIDRELNRSFQEFYTGFLSEKEIEDVIEGKDIWLNNQEVEERWKNKKHLNK
jgi:ATP-dependent Clp protease, protease subunit